MLADDTNINFDVHGPVTPEGLNRWREACVSSRLADNVWLPPGAATFSGSLRKRTISDLLLLQLEADPYGLKFNAGSATAQYVGFAIHSNSFDERVLFADHTQRIKNTKFGLWDHEQIAESELLSPAALTMLMIPKSALDRSRGALTDWRRSPLLDKDCASVRVLTNLVASLASEVDGLSSAAGAAARNAVVELLVAVLRECAPTATAAGSDALRYLISQWIEDNLYLGHIPPAKAARCHNISVRTLHRLYSATGETFGAVVRRRRIERAQQDLVVTNDLVQTIAVRWGYADASHFIYEFKRFFGTTPLQFRRSADEPAGVPQS